MKYSEMNKRQQRAFTNIKYAADSLLGGLENTLQDYDKDSKEYIKADKLLNNRQLLIEMLYSMATTGIYGEGYECFDKRACQQELRDINFCGKDWLMERCEKRIIKEGY